MQLVTARTTTSALELPLGRISICVQPGFGAALLRAVVDALGEGAAWSRTESRSTWRPSPWTCGWQ